MICFIRQLMKKSKQGLLIFPPKISLIWKGQERGLFDVPIKILKSKWCVKENRYCFFSNKSSSPELELRHTTMPARQEWTVLTRLYNYFNKRCLKNCSLVHSKFARHRVFYIYIYIYQNESSPSLRDLWALVAVKFLKFLICQLTNPRIFFKTLLTGQYAGSIQRLP